MLRDPSIESPYCVGRDAELERVRAALHAAALGEGSALVWVGESGAGKTRFLRECASLKVAAATIGLRCGQSARFGPRLPAQLAAALALPARDRQAQHERAVLAALATRTKRRAVALLLDDLDRADASELAFVDALVALAAHHPLAVVGCASHWDRASGEVRLLPPLDDAAMELLVHGLAGPRTLQSGDVREILATAQGIPRLGIELVAQLRSPGGMCAAPASAQRAAAELRETLDRGDFEVLLACSIIGDAFCGDWLPQIAERPAAAVADALQRAVELGVLEPTPGSPQWLRFRSIALRVALDASIVALKGRLLHERIVAVLAAAHDAPCAPMDELLARHAETLGDRELAAAAFARAAARAREAGAFPEAAELYLRAAEQTPRGDERWIGFQQYAMTCHENAGNWRSVEPVARCVLETVDWKRDAQSAENALQDLFFAQLNGGDPAGAERTAQQIASLGLPTSETRGRVATLILAYLHCYSGRLDEAARLVATVEPHHLERGGEVALRYYVARAEIGALVSPLQATLELIDRAFECAEGHVRGRVQCYAAAAEIACRYGDLATARNYIARAEHVALEKPGAINDVRRRILKERTRIAMLSGDLLVTHELVRQNVGWRETGQHNEAFDMSVAVHAGMRLGDLALVDAFLDPQLLYDSLDARDGESCGLLLFGYADAMQVRGMAKDLRNAAERCVAEGLIDPYGAVQLCAIRLASPECATRALEQTEAYFAAAIAPAAAAHLALARATYQRRRGRHAAAAQEARTAAERFAAMGWRLYAALALELAGDLRAASRTYEQCGASADVVRLAARETRKHRYAPFGARLSTREREVARLVIAQRSNREIARALEISVRTVDHHVEAIFSKLGIRARWELTAVDDTGAGLRAGDFSPPSRRP